MDWLLKCTQQVDDNVIGLLHRSVKDVLCHQDKEVQKAAEAAKEAAEKARDHSQDSARRQCYQEAQDHDSEPSNSKKEASRALSQVHIHLSGSESSMAPDTSEPDCDQGAKEEDMEVSSQEMVVAAGGSQDDDFRPTPQTP